MTTSTYTHKALAPYGVLMQGFVPVTLGQLFPQGEIIVVESVHADSWAEGESHHINLLSWTFVHLSFSVEAHF